MVNNKELTVRVINVIDYTVFTFNLQNLSCLTFNTKIVRKFDIKFICTEIWSMHLFLYYKQLFTDS